MKYFIKIDEIMKLPVTKRAEEAERVIEEVLGEFDAEWTEYLTYKEIIKIINNGGKLKDVENAVKAAKKFEKIKYVIISTIVAVIFIVLPIALYLF